MTYWWEGKCHDQTTHEEINSQYYPSTRELCCMCCEPTGRAGAGEDSLFTEYDGPFCEHDGPFCEECYPSDDGDEE